MQKNRRAFWNSLVILAVSIAYSGAAVVHAQREVNAKIIEGSLRPVAEYPMVAQLYVGEGTCTGTLISSRHVLTAAHCFFDDASEVVTDTGEMSAILGGNTYEVKKVSIHPTYVARSDNACVADEVDAAVIELKSEISNISPIPLLRSAPIVGTELLIVGFGTQGGGESGEDGTFPEDGFVNIGHTTLERVSSNLYVDWDFDIGESNTASGDSGGPAFMDVDGVRYINSITCGGTGQSEYGSDSTNTRADAIASWVDSILGIDNGGGGSKSMKISKAKVDFGENNNYTFFLQGAIDVGKNFDPKNATFQISFADYSDSFKLNKGGFAQRRGGDDYVELLGKMTKGKFKASSVKFGIGLADKESLFESLSAFFPEEPDSSTRVDLPITINLKGIQYNATVSMKAQKLGERWTK